jgi:hypothetical protein
MVERVPSLAIGRMILGPSGLCLHLRSRCVARRGPPTSAYRALGLTGPLGRGTGHGCAA